MDPRLIGPFMICQLDLDRIPFTAKMVIGRVQLEASCPLMGRERFRLPAGRTAMCRTG